jgi:carbamate kinase
MFDRDKGYIANSKKSLGKVEIDIAKSVVQASGTEPGSMEPSVVEAAFKLKGDATVKGTVTLKLAWQPFSARG